MYRFMQFVWLALKNISDNALRSWVVAVCAALVAGFPIMGTLLNRGIEDSLQRVIDRLGADIMVIPAGNQTYLEQALVSGVPVAMWMPDDVIPTVAGVPGVEIVTPQLLLSTMRGASCCSVSDMLMIAYEPATDFTVHPWLEENLDRELQLGESIAGTYIFVPEGRTNILIYGYEMELAGSLEPTGSGLDQSMFFTFETALEIARLSPMQAERELVIQPDSISAALVRLAAGADPGEVAVQIESRVPGVTAIQSDHLFRTQRERILGLLRSAALLSGVAWVVMVLLVGLVTSTALADRRREIGVLRALGAPRHLVFQSLLAEGVILALAGGITGAGLAAAVVFLFRNLFIRLAGLPLLLPTPLELLSLSLAVLGLALCSVVVASLYPILRAAREEPGTAIKDW